MQRTVFEQYGGFSTVNRVVSDFYEKMLDSPVTSSYFDHIDMRRLVDHQTRFISALMGGPASYSDDQLARAHANLGITETAFNEAMALLRETLEDHDYETEDINQVVDAMLARRHVIVTRQG